MQSIWLDEWDLPHYGDTGDVNLNARLAELKSKWLFEFDTVDNRREMRMDYRDAITEYLIVDKRDEKIDSLLNDKG